LSQARFGESLRGIENEKEQVALTQQGQTSPFPFLLRKCAWKNLVFVVIIIMMMILIMCMRKMLFVLPEMF